MSIHGTLPVASWTAPQVVAWVTSLGPPFSPLAQNFVGVNGQRLEELTNAILIAKPLCLSFPQARLLLEKREEVKKKIVTLSLLESFSEGTSGSDLDLGDNLTDLKSESTPTDTIADTTLPLQDTAKTPLDTPTPTSNTVPNTKPVLPPRPTHSPALPQTPTTPLTQSAQIRPSLPPRPTIPPRVISAPHLKPPPPQSQPPAMLIPNSNASVYLSKPKPPTPTDAKPAPPTPAPKPSTSATEPNAPQNTTTSGLRSSGGLPPKPAHPPTPPPNVVPAEQDMTQDNSSTIEERSIRHPPALPPREQVPKASTNPAATEQVPQQLPSRRRTPSPPPKEMKVTPLPLEDTFTVQTEQHTLEVINSIEERLTLPPREQAQPSQEALPMSCSSMHIETHTTSQKSSISPHLDTVTQAGSGTEYTVATASPVIQQSTESAMAAPPKKEPSETKPLPPIPIHTHSTAAASVCIPEPRVYEPTPESDPTCLPYISSPEGDSDNETAEGDWKFDADSDSESEVEVDQSASIVNDEGVMQPTDESQVSSKEEELKLQNLGQSAQEATPTQSQIQSIAYLDVAQSHSWQSTNQSAPQRPPNWFNSIGRKTGQSRQFIGMFKGEEGAENATPPTQSTSGISHPSKQLPPLPPTAQKPMHIHLVPGKPLPAAPAPPSSGTTTNAQSQPLSTPTITVTSSPTLSSSPSQSPSISVVTPSPTPTPAPPVSPTATQTPAATSTSTSTSTFSSTSTSTPTPAPTSHPHPVTTHKDAPKRKPKKDDFAISDPITFKHTGHLGAAMESWGTGATLRDQPMPVPQPAKPAEPMFKLKNISNIISEIPVGAMSTKLRKNLALFQTSTGSGETVPALPSKIIHDRAALVTAIRSMENLAWGSGFVDHWTSSPYPHETWTGTEPNIEKYGVPAIDVACTTPAGGAFSVEYDARSVTSTKRDEIEPFGFIDPHRYFLFYKEFFYGQPHDIFCCISEGSPIIAAIQQVESKEVLPRRVLIISKKGVDRALIPSTESARFVGSSILRLKDTKLVRVKAQTELSKDLLNFEERSCVRAYKIGVLWVKPNQIDENDIFSNLETDASPRYQEFLDFLGTKVTLEGWTKYRAGLDVKTGSTGKFSVYTSFRDYEIMYHVCTYLPFQPDDLQRVERKRHIGNDVVSVIFKERDPTNPKDLFTPKLLTSHFLHGFFLVEAIVDSTTNATTGYNIIVANKAGVSPYPPFMPEPVSFPNNEQTREWLLLKMINSERTALIQSPEFRGMMTARKGSLMNVCKTYMSKKE
ncbi:GTPaseactivating protein [Pelomyxa schiedti]|nr:GTPaseactivating protein [Pelomyxa schiedti]